MTISNCQIRLHKLCNINKETNAEFIMTTEGLNTQISLDPAPQDSVSRISFFPSGRALLVSTWAGTVGVHDTATGTLRHEAKRASSAILDATWTCETAVAAASLDGLVMHATIGEASITDWRELGSHDQAVRSIVVLPDAGGIIASGGWDSRLRTWDVKTAKCVLDIDAGGKVYGATNCGEQSLIFINSNSQVRLLDLRKPSEFVHDKVPPTLTHQLRGISASHNGKQYVVGSTEGRVAVEWFDDEQPSFSFKCHRLEGMAFPVNCIAHPSKYSSFATGGGDGHVSFWDGEARKRIAQYTRYSTSVASIDFDSKSQRIAIAVSYTFEEGEKDHPPDEVHIRDLDDSHIATKTCLQ